MAAGEVLFTTNTTDESRNTTTSSSEGNDEDGTGNRKAGPETPTSQDLAMETTSSSAHAPTRHQRNASPASWTKQRNNGNNSNCHNNYNNHYRTRNRTRGPIASAGGGAQASHNNNNGSKHNASDSNSSVNPNNNNNASNRRSHKRPRRHHKRNSSAKHLRRNTQPAPNNNNEFLMKEHDDHFYYNNQLIDNGNKSLPFLTNGQQQQHHRQRSYSSSQDDPLGLDALVNGGEQFSSTSDEEEEAYLVRDFSNAYEVVHAERLNMMTKPELILEYQLLEERVESLEHTLRTVVEEKSQAKIHLDRSGSSSGVGEEHMQQYDDDLHKGRQTPSNENATEFEKDNGAQDTNSQQQVSAGSGDGNVSLNYSEDYYNSSDEDDETRNSGLLLTSTMLSQFQQELFRLRDENRKLRSDNKVLLKGTGGYRFTAHRGREAQHIGHAVPDPPAANGDAVSADVMCDTASGSKGGTTSTAAYDAQGNYPPDLASSSFAASPPRVPGPTAAHNSTSTRRNNCDDSEDSFRHDGGLNEASTSWNDVSTSSHTRGVSSYATMTSPGRDDNVSSTAIL